MDIILKNGTIITGDGKTVIKKGTVYIDKGIIQDVIPGNPDHSIENTRQIIDAFGCYIIPGVINTHAHGCSTGPLFPSGAKPLPLERVKRNAGKMLTQGVTTLINVCGFPLIEEIEPVTSKVPMNIKPGTCHLPLCFKSADMVDGSGLTGKHRQMTAEKMLEKGAVVIGEMGSGASLGGGVTDYKYIPEAVEKETGVRISTNNANHLKTAVLGRTLEKGRLDKETLEAVMKESGIEGKIDVKKLCEIIEEVALGPVSLSLQSFDEAAELSSQTGIPAVFHNSLVSAPKILQLAKKYRGTKAVLVAGHSNHPTFNKEEALHYAKELKKHGAIIDISTLDGIITKWMNNTENLDALVKEGIVDTISTDYGGSHWDGIPEAVHHLVNNGITTIENAVAMATGNPAKIYKKAAPNRGLIQKGKIADIIITDDKNPGRIEMVLIDGKTAWDVGRLYPL